MSRKDIERSLRLMTDIVKPGFSAEFDAALAKVKAKLFKELLEIAKKRKLIVAVSVFPLPRMRDAPRNHPELRPSGFYIKGVKTILMSPNGVDDVFTLAHEIGHHEMWRRCRTFKSNKNEEVVVDKYSRGLILRTLKRIECSDIIRRELLKELEEELG